MGWPALKYVVSVGAVCGLFSSLLGAMFPLPRIIYAMGSDGLLFKILAIVHPKFHTPLTGTLIAGAIAGIFEVPEFIVFQIKTHYSTRKVKYFFRCFGLYPRARTLG